MEASFHQLELPPQTIALPAELMPDLRELLRKGLPDGFMRACVRFGQFTPFHGGRKSSVVDGPLVLHKDKAKPLFANHWPLLKSIAESQLAAQRGVVAPPNGVAYELQANQVIGICQSRWHSAKVVCTRFRRWICKVLGIRYLCDNPVCGSGSMCFIRSMGDQPAGTRLDGFAEIVNKPGTIPV